MTRNGKIARLPRTIRDELNRRLDEGVQGGSLIRWLNKLPAVKSLVARDFGGVAISKQNLCEWRAGGFAEWQARQEMLEHSRELAADAREIADATDGTLGDHLATVLAARYAAVLSGWNGEPDEPFQRKLRVLRSLCQDIAVLRRGDHHSARVKLKQEQMECAKEKKDAELVELFQDWLKKPEVQDVVSKTCLSAEEREHRLRVIFGLEPEPEKSPAEAAIEQENEYRKIFGMAPLPLPQPAEAEDDIAENEAGTACPPPQSPPAKAESKVVGEGKDCPCPGNGGPVGQESEPVKPGQTKSNQFTNPEEVKAGAPRRLTSAVWELV